MRMHNYKTGLLVSAAIVLSACGPDPRDASKANFKTALNNHLPKMRECVQIGNKPDEQGFIEAFRTDGLGFGADQKGFYDALAAEGLLETTQFQKQELNFSKTQMINYVGYKFTHEGQIYLRPDKYDNGFFAAGIPQLCYGTAEVIEITNFTVPAESVGVKTTSITYTYHVIDIAPWAKTLALVEKYDWVSGRIAADQFEGEEDLVLTNNGWVHHSAYEN